MSHTLSCDFVVKSERGAIYWWPLIFAAMEHHSFSFSHPDQPKGTGYYYSNYPKEGLEHTSASYSFSSFKEVWNEIYADRGEILVSFWSTRSTFPKLENLDVSLSESKDDHIVSVSLSLAGAELMGITDEEVNEYFTTFFGFAQMLYAICQPCTGEMYWEYAGENYNPIATFGKPLETFPTRSVYDGSGYTFQQIAHKEEQGFSYRLDPVPVPIPNHGGWKFVSVSSDLNRMRE